MPTKAVAAETMEIGKKGGGKHWTAAQKAARQRAADTLKRKGKVEISAPEWLSSGALFIWNRLINDAANMSDGGLLDNLDTDALATYCHAVDRYQTLARMLDQPAPAKKILVDVSESAKDDADMGVEDIERKMQGWARIIAQYADKLGFTPQARARLVKRRADPDEGNGKNKNNFGSKFD